MNWDSRDWNFNAPSGPTTPLLYQTLSLWLSSENHDFPVRLTPLRRNPGRREDFPILGTLDPTKVVLISRSFPVPRSFDSFDTVKRRLRESIALYKEISEDSKSLPSERSSVPSYRKRQVSGPTLYFRQYHVTSFITESLDLWVSEVKEPVWRLERSGVKGVDLLLEVTSVTRR